MGVTLVLLQVTDRELAERVPVVLAGTICDGSEGSLADCAGYSLGRRRIPTVCVHSSDVYLVCTNRTDPGIASQA